MKYVETDKGKIIRQLYEQGLNDKQIAEKIGISRSAVQNIRNNQLKLPNKYHKGKEFVCEYCNKKFVTSPSKRGKYNKHIFCSKECACKWRIGKKRTSYKRVKKICKQCGKEYEVIKYRENKSSFCSDKCKFLYFRREKHPNWKGGIAPYFNYDETWIKKREEALIRDNYTCVVCGSRKNLEVHHIIPYRLVGKHEIENLVTLCEKCHHKFEKDSIELLKGKIGGHPDFTRLLIKMWMLHIKKNYQYASSKDPLSNFRRCGKLCEKLIKVNNKPLAMALFYMSKQVDAVYEMVGENKKDTIEQLEDKLLDIAVYSLLCIILNKEGNI